MSKTDFFRLDGKVAVVTGGGRGIGEGVARRLSAAGAQVAILDLDEDSAQMVATSITGLGLKCDVTSAASIQNAIAEVQGQFGSIAILVNNAGIAGRTGMLWELEESDLDQVYSVNLKSVFLMCQSVVPEMLSHKYGRIVNVASISGKEGNPGMIPYSTTKAAVICLTKALAKEVAGKGDITVNSISPAVIQTRILEGLSQQTINYMISRIPMGRTGKIEEISALVHYLVSPEASFTTGQCYDISGGRATY